MLLPRGRRWIQSRLTLLVLLGFIHGLLFWDGDILLAYGLVGLICWRLVRDAPSVKSLFNTGVMLYLVGLGVLLLLGLISDSQTSRAWTPDASVILYEKYWKLHGGVEAINGIPLMALNSLRHWRHMAVLAGMMPMCWIRQAGGLKGQFSLRHYRRTGFAPVAIGVIINLPAIALQWRLDWAYRWLRLLTSDAAGTECAVSGDWLCNPLFYGFWPQLSRFKLVLAIACVGRMALTNYLLQTLICTTLFYHLGLFMHFDRLELLAFVIPVWLANILFSVIWLRHLCVAVEWLWRQLTLRAAWTGNI